MAILAGEREMFVVARANTREKYNNNNSVSLV
jgi:hypothetical protein